MAGLKCYEWNKKKTLTISDALKKVLKLTHPESSDLAFLYGTIVTDGKDQYCEDVTWNVCVFAEREVIVF